MCSSLKTDQVELSVLAPSGNDAVGEDMKNFADQLRPLVSENLATRRRPQTAILFPRWSWKSSI